MKKKIMAMCMLIIFAGWGLIEAKEIILTTTDQVDIYGSLTTSKNDNDKLILLFHQAQSNRKEYEPLLPSFLKLGLDCLAIDQRSGGSMWGTENKTVSKRGRPSSYLSALPDLQAALDWARQQDYQTIIGVGSSYSASLIFLLAEHNPKTITALASFSPGEYFNQPDLVKTAVAKLRLPIYITAASSDIEQNRISELLKPLKDKSGITRYDPEIAIHGVSSLRADRNQTGAKKNLEHFLNFLKKQLD